MLMHPFSDQSGICLYSTESTIVTSIGVKRAEFIALLKQPDMSNEKHSAIIQELLSKQFIEEVLD